MALLRGIGTPRDDERGVRWLRRAAAAGNSPALGVLARCYHSGRGVERDRERAREMLGLYRAATSAEAKGKGSVGVAS
eukprot:contig_34090_g8211